MDFGILGFIHKCIQRFRDLGIQGYGDFEIVGLWDLDIYRFGDLGILGFRESEIKEFGY